MTEEAAAFTVPGGEIHSPGDLEGLDVRVQQSETALSMARALGARPVTADYSELYRTLQSKEADAADCKLLCSGIL